MCDSREVHQWWARLAGDTEDANEGEAAIRQRLLRKATMRNLGCKSVAS